MSCDVGEVTERLENELCCVCVRDLLILQPFHHFTYVTTHSPILPSLYLRHSSFSNPSVASPTSEFILQPFFRFSYVTSSSLNSPDEPPMILPFPQFHSTNILHFSISPSPCHFIFSFIHFLLSFTSFMVRKNSLAHHRWVIIPAHWVRSGVRNVSSSIGLWALANTV